MHVVSLCDRTGVMVEPWLAAGFDAWTVDLQAAPGVTEHPSGALRYFVRADVRDLPDVIPSDPAAVFAFPPCTDLAISGARWMRGKGLGSLIDALRTVDACGRYCADSGAPWLLENPVGVLSTWLGKPDLIFDPCDFAGWADDPRAEAYTKRTCLWTGGGFLAPYKRWVEPTLGSLMHHLPPSADRGDLRSVTPQGFARAVFEANAPLLTAPAPSVGGREEGNER